MRDVPHADHREAGRWTGHCHERGWDRGQSDLYSQLEAISLGSSGRLGLVQDQAYGAFFEPVVLLQVEMSTVRCVVLGEREEVADQGLQPGSACRRQPATTAGAPTDQARVCLAVPPPTLASPFAVIWRASPVAVRAQRVARTTWVVVLDVDDQGPGVLPWMSGSW